MFELQVFLNYDEKTKLKPKEEIGKIKILKT
jgi:hypothetical protein